MDVPHVTLMGNNVLVENWDYNLSVLQLFSSFKLREIRECLDYQHELLISHLRMSLRKVGGNKRTKIAKLSVIRQPTRLNVGVLHQYRGGIVVCFSTCFAFGVETNLELLVGFG